MRLFGTMRLKILLALLVAGLIPLVATSALFFYHAQQIIVDDRVEIYLKHISQQTIDKIDLLLTQRRAEIGTLASDDRFRDLDRSPDRFDPRGLEGYLNEKSDTLEVYDLLLLVGLDGRIRAFNTVNRFGERFDPRICADSSGAELKAYPEEQRAFETALQKGYAVQAFYSSRLTHAFYNFDRDDQSRSFQAVFAQAIHDPYDRRPVGVLVALMNWEFIQGNLDLVEKDFDKLGLKSGYALLLDRNGQQILATPLRANRKGGAAGSQLGQKAPPTLANRLALAIRQGADTMEYPSDQQQRYAGISRSSLPEFNWLLLVSLSAEDIFGPVTRLSWTFAVIGGVALLLTLFTALLLSRNLSRPLRRLTETSRRLSGGEQSLRVDIRSGGEIGELAAAFNAMAGTIEERQLQLEEANRRLEEKVWERTRALEESNTELRCALGDLREAQDQLVRNEKMASLGRLVAGIAHEIKNPLNFIYGNTGFLGEYAETVRDFTRFVESQGGKGEAGAAAVREYAEARNIPFILEDLPKIAQSINEGAERIRSIVDDLRSFSRAPTGTRQPVDLRVVLDMCLNLLRNLYKQRIRVVREYEEIPPVTVYAGKIEQVFLNLITNAVQAVAGDGEIRLSVRPGGDMVVTEIADSGPGIPPEHLHKIFEPFFTTKDVGQGTGLGLSISFNIVRQHGGRLTARNIPGGGAAFRVELPAGPGRETTAEAQPPASPLEPTAEADHDA